MKIEQAPLAHYRTLDQYSPKIGDICVNKGWFTTWVGVVLSYDSDIISIAFEGSPRLLVTMLPHEISKNTYKYKFSDIVLGRVKSFNFYQVEKQTPIWYV